MWWYMSVFVSGTLDRDQDTQKPEFFKTSSEENAVLRMVFQSRFGFEHPVPVYLHGPFKTLEEAQDAPHAFKNFLKESTPALKIIPNEKDEEEFE